ncbi:MAG: hypothetical protein AB9M60_10780 [Leptothrix sp. (in: b-proteobacteria)]
MKTPTAFAALILSTLALFSVGAHAADAACDAAAADKKLAGAAKNSFLKKCEREASAKVATAACDTKATEKKLAGAAKNSFLKKCVADAAK